MEGNVKIYEFAQRMERLRSESAFDVLAKAKMLEAQGKNIIHLEIGEPDFDTPKNIIEKAVWALNNGYTHYTPAPGMMELRKSIAKYISKTRNVDVMPEEVIVGPGVKPVLTATIMMCVETDSEVIYPNPTYPTYESIINFVDAKPVPLPLLEEREFSFEVAELERRITPKTKMIVLNSPENPTGGVLTLDDLKYIADLAVKHDLLIISDEIYSRMLYDNYKHQSIISLPGMKERTILLDGFSKTYAMTGWRLGYGVMPLPIAEKLSKIMLNMVSCTATFVQIAGIEALEGDQGEVDSMFVEFAERRDIIVDGLNKIKGITCKKPHGAFYVFPNFSSFGLPSKKIADYLLNEAHVACLEGTAFGKHGEGYLRFSYANSIANINEALSRIENAMGKLTDSLHLSKT